MPCTPKELCERKRGLGEKVRLLFPWPWSRPLTPQWDWWEERVCQSLVKHQPYSYIQLKWSNKHRLLQNASKITGCYSQMSCLLCVKTMKAFLWRQWHYRVLNQSRTYQLWPWSCTCSWGKEAFVKHSFSDLKRIPLLWINSQGVEQRKCKGMESTACKMPADCIANTSRCLGTPSPRPFLYQCHHSSWQLPSSPENCLYILNDFGSLALGRRCSR